MAEELKKNLRTRSGHRLVVKNAFAKHKEFLPPAGASVPNEIKPRLISFKNTLIRKRKDLEKIDAEILEAITKDEEIEKEILEREEFEQEIEDYLSLIEIALADVERSNEQPQTQSTPRFEDKVKLPKLSLATFNGDVTKWTSFWDSFQSTIGDHGGLSKIDKLKYLVNSLTGPAAQTLAGLQISNDSYDEAIELLEKRFGNKQVIITSFMDSLRELPKISTSDDIRRLRILYDKTEAAVRSLKSVGVSCESYGTVLSRDIMAKLPQDIRLTISRNLEDEWDLQGLIKNLGDELSLRERCTLTSVTPTTLSRQTPQRDSRGYLAQNSTTPKTSTTSTLFLGNEGSSKSSQFIPSCLFCGNKHFSASCRTVSDPNARKKILRDKRRCFVCLKGNHTSRECVSRSNCYHCNERHHAAICGANGENRRPTRNLPAQDPPAATSTPNARQPPPVAAQTVSTNYTSNDSLSNVTLLQTAKTEVHSIDNPRNRCNVRVILDSCSQKTYVTTRLKDELNIPSFSTKEILIKEFGNEQGTLKTCETIQLAVHCADNLTVYINAFVVDLICSPLSHQAIDFAQANYSHLRNLPLADSGDGSQDLEIDILIGADFVHLFMLDQVIRGEHPMSPVAMSTRFGYVLSGPLQIPSQNECSANITVAHVLKTDTILAERKNDLEDEIKRFWNNESFGVKPNENLDDFESQNLMQDKIKFDGKRYEISLPLKDDHPIVPDNYSVAKSRLNSQLDRLKLKPEVFDQYNSVIKDQLKSGIIERVIENEEILKPGMTHYIPHIGVVKQERQTTKLRIVYDASSKVQGEVSLNDCLHPGPNLAPLIFDVLLKFRVHKIALIGDLEKAFLQISIDPSQRDLLRFLWIDESDPENPKIVKLRFARLAFGLSCSPFILNSTIRHHLENYEESDPEFVRKVISSLYVDDFASSFASEDESFAFYEKLKQRFSEAGWNMRKFNSNDKKLRERIEDAENARISNDHSKAKENQNILTQTENRNISHAVQKEDEIKVLGMTWNAKTDKLKFDLASFHETAAQEKITKRLILSSIARIYDPLGLLSPLLVPLKRLFQDVCRLKVNWDACLPDEFCQRWHNIVDDIPQGFNVEIDRSFLGDLSSDEIRSIQIHGFSDASQTAYGAVVYLRIKTDKGIVTKLVSAKTRISPLKNETMPRLELMASLILARLITSVKNNLRECCKIESIHCWCDSQIVLYWLLNENKIQKQFVQNRLVQIRNLVANESWGYCPSAHNPADLTSRGVSFSKIVAKKLWWEGPEFLCQEEEFWPKFEGTQPSEENIERSIVHENSNTLMTTNLPIQNLNAIISCEKFSSFDKLIRITALVLRFVNRLKRKVSTEDSQELISSQDISEAKTYWHKEAQKAFVNDNKFEETKKVLRVFTDEKGVIRVKGRIDEAPLPYETKYPVLLPKRHHFTHLVVYKSHSVVKHNGVRETLMQVRSEYWICKGRQVVKTLVSKCVTCKRIMGKPYDTPLSPPLPKFRVSEDTAFSNIGIDFAGPLFVKDVYSKTGEMYKCYIALFTCASTRALHLELVPDLHANSFIRAFTRFIGRRGLPSRIVSDNGKTFLDRNVCTFVNSLGIVWSFNIPTASWWGGFFESMVKLTKRCLRKTLGNAHLTYEELETVLLETEGVLNSRPLTFLYNDITEPPITPSCLVSGRRLLDRPSFTQRIDDSNYESLTKRAKYLKTLLSRFFSRWKNEYLPSLREHENKQNNIIKRVPEVGDIVTIHKDLIPRQRWVLGKITRLFQGAEGIVRAAEVLTFDKSGKKLRVKRPIQKLYPLEVRCPQNEVEKRQELSNEVSITTVRDEDVIENIREL